MLFFPKYDTIGLFYMNMKILVLILLTSTN